MKYDLVIFVKNIKQVDDRYFYDSGIYQMKWKRLLQIENLHQNLGE